MDEAANFNARRKALKYAIFTYVVYIIIAHWWITYDIAGICNYHPLLGGMRLGNMHLYGPWSYFIWSNTESISRAIPDLLNNYGWANPAGYILSILTFFFLHRSLKVSTSHGSAAFATEEDIEKSDLGSYVSANGGVYKYKKKKVKKFGIFETTVKEKILKNSGVVVGVNPYTKRLMLHDGVEHILLMAPTRSGKGVNTIIPTGVVWKHSIFFFDPKGELWQNTSGYRKKVLHQKVLKFQPLCSDGSGAHWNPLAEIDYRTAGELTDVMSITGIMVRPNGEQKGGDDFWPNSAQALLNGVVLHLLYQHDKEGLPLPSPSDIMSFLSSPDKDTETLFTDMKTYPHISIEEFLESPLLDKDGNELKDASGLVIRRKNPLKEIYGEYIKDFRPFANELGFPVKSIDEIRAAVQAKIDAKEKINWDYAIDDIPTGKPYYLLLTHPKVAESAANMLNGAEQTRASIMQTAQTAMALYQNPVVQENTKTSDFTIRDMLDPKRAVSVYLVMEVRDVATIRPLARLFIQLICDKLIHGMKKEKDAPKGPIYQAVPTCPICGSKMELVNGEYHCINKECGLTLKSALCKLGDRTVPTPDTSDFICPACKRPLERVVNDEGKFYWRCSEYPDCNVAFAEDENKRPDFKSSKEICPTCGGELHKVKEDIWTNWVCEHYQQCRVSFSDDHGRADRSAKKQRLLLMLDEFPQLGNMKCIELALAICAGYGIKMCIVCQDVNQLNKEYTKDNSIGSNCHLHIYFTPNIDAGGATAEAISKTLGKKTIKTVSHSDGGGGFAKGSDSTSSTGRELMTPDEVSHMSSEKELVFVAGHRAIFGDKLRYYLHSFLLSRTKIDEPAISDTVTQVNNYADFFAIHGREKAEKDYAQKLVYKEQADRLKITYKDYMVQLEEEKNAREKEIVDQIYKSKFKDDDRGNKSKPGPDQPGPAGAPARAQRQVGGDGDEDEDRGYMEIPRNNRGGTPYSDPDYVEGLLRQHRKEEWENLHREMPDDEKPVPPPLDDEDLRDAGLNDFDDDPMDFTAFTDPDNDDFMYGGLPKPSLGDPDEEDDGEPSTAELLSGNSD